MQKKLVLLIFVAVIGLAGSTVVPPTLFVNIFFAQCFQAKTGMEWRSIVDFIIFHTSWFDNSDVGSCASDNPNVLDEARCWKNAFSQLISSSSPLRQVANECVDRFVEFTHNIAANSSNQQNELIDMTSPSLDSTDCPFVDVQTFVQTINNRLESSSIALPSFDKTLQNVPAIIAFVQESGLCKRRSCDECNCNYLTPGYPPTLLKCRDCWPTRLAGMIKSSSQLKTLFTDVARKLGNNQLPVPSSSPFLNQYMTSCLARNRELNESGNLASLVDFIIYHTTWFQRSNRGSCRPGNPNLLEETQCWLNAYGYLIRKSSPLLKAARGCVIDYTNYVIQLHPNKGSLEEVTIRDFNITTPTVPNNILSWLKCPKSRTLTNIAAKLNNFSARNPLRPEDQTLNDIPFILKTVEDEFLCIKPVCRNCANYRFYQRNEYRRNGFGSALGRIHNRNRCNDCKHTRFAAMIKRSSPLKLAVLLSSKQYNK